MTNIAVAGAAGRMGSRIVRLIKDSEEIRLSGGFERSDHPNIGRDLGDLLGLGKAGIELKGSIDQAITDADVLIDFSTPDSTLGNIRKMAEMGKAMVIGTTGISGEKENELKHLAQKIPCVISPNMSLGVNILFKIARDISKILGKDYDMEVLESHHRLKKDSPSGTAIQLARVLAESTNTSIEKDAVYGRKGFTGIRKHGEIGIHSIRAGDIVGEHTVIFAGTGERIEITHRAHTRDNFARGAIMAAAWVVKQPRGIYDMQDVLGLKEG